MKRILTIFLILACLFGLAACNNESAYMNSYGGGSGGVAMSAPRNMDLSDSAGWNDVSANTDTRAETAGEVPVDAVRVIIRDANMDIEAQDASELYRSLVAYNKELGGYEFSSNQRNYDNYSIINAVFKVPPEKLDTFMEFAGENGKIVNSRMDSRDVTDEFYDMTARVETKRRSRESYFNMLEKAVSVEEIIILQRTIDNISKHRSCRPIHSLL